MLEQRPCPPPHPSPSKPLLSLPAGATDAHCHVFGPAAIYPFSPTRGYTPEDAPVEQLEALHDMLGVTNAVYVQASCHGFDNQAMLDAIARRPATRRGVCIVPAEVSPSQLLSYNAAGVRGARVNFMKRLATSLDRDAITALAHRLADLRWHLVVHFDADMIEELADWMSDLPLPVVIDHMARLSADQVDSNEMCTLLRLLERQHIWCKISGAERSSLVGAPWHDILPLAHAIVGVAPQRVLWGTDWPHPVLHQPMPDDGKLVDLIGALIPQQDLQHQILVENPKQLYGF